MANDNQLQVDIVFSPEKAKAQLQSAMGDFARTAESIFAASEARKTSITTDGVRKQKQVNGEYQDWWKRSLTEQSSFEKMLRQAQVEDNRRNLATQVSDQRSSAKQAAEAVRDGMQFEKMLRQAHIEDIKRMNMRASAEAKAQAAADRAWLSGTDTTSGRMLSQLGIKTPQQTIQEIGLVKSALSALSSEGTKSGVVVDQLNTKLRLLETGNARGRGELHKLTAAMASFTFEMTGAVYGITALASIIVAPAFFGTAMLKRIEDAQTGITGILISMGTLDGKSLTFGQAWKASAQYVKAVQADSMKYGIDMGRLMEVNQAAMSGGLNAMMNLEQIQKVATAGAIAVSSLGLNSQQYVQEVRDLISGGIQPASSTLARSIGVTDALLKQWKAQGPEKLVKELTDRLQGFMVVADEVRSKTLTGSWDILQARLAMLLSDEQGFGAIKKAVIDAANWIGKVDVTGKFVINPDAVAMAQAYWGNLKSIGSVLSDIGSIIASLSPVFAKLAQFISMTEITFRMLFLTAKTGFTQLAILVKGFVDGDFSGALKKVSAAGQEWSKDMGVLVNKLGGVSIAFFGLGEASKEALDKSSSSIDDWRKITGKSADEAIKNFNDYAKKHRVSSQKHHDETIEADKLFYDARLKSATAFSDKMVQLQSIADMKRNLMASDTRTQAEKDVLLAGLSAKEKSLVEAAQSKALSDLQKTRAGMSFGSTSQSTLAQLAAELEAKNAATTTELSNVAKVELAWEKHTKNRGTQQEYLKALRAAEIADVNKVGLELLKDSNQQIDAINKQIEAQKLHNETIGKTPEQIAIAKAAFEDAATNELATRAEMIRAAASQAGIYENIYIQEANRIDELVKKRREMAGLLNTAAEKEAVKATRDLEKKAHEEMWKTIEGYAKNTWDAVFTKGGNAFREIGKVIKSSILDMLYKMTVQKWIFQISGVAVGAGGASAAAAAGMGGGGGTGDWLSAGKSIYNILNDGVSTAITEGFTKLAGSSFGQSMGWSTTTTNAQGVQMQSLSDSGMMMNAGLKAIGNAAAGYMLQKTISGEYKIGNGKIVDALTLAASAWFGPVAGIVAGIANRAFGMGAKQSGTTTLAGQFNEQGFGGQYQTPWSQKGGWFRSDKSGMDIQAVAAEQQAALSALVGGTKSVFDNLVSASGDANKSITGWTFAINRQIATQEQQNQLIIDMADSMGTYLIPELAAFKLEGENLADTAVRMRDEFILTDTVLRLVGGSFGAVGLASMGARDNLVQLMGGIQGMNTTMQSYYQNFFTDAERHANDLGALTIKFAQLGMIVPTSADAFKLLVSSQDLSTESGRQLFAALMSLNGAFAALIPSAEAAAQAVTANIKALQDKSVEDYKAARAATDSLRAFATSVRELQRSLWAGSQTPLASTYAVTRSQFAATNTLAGQGDVAAQGNLAGAATAFLEASKKQAMSAVEYAMDFATVQSALSDTATLTDQAVTVADRQLEQLKLANAWLSGIDSKSAVQNTSLEYLLAASIASSDAARMAVVEQALTKLSADIATAVGSGYSASNLSSSTSAAGDTALSYASAYKTIGGSVSATGSASALTETVSASQQLAKTAEDARIAKETAIAAAISAFSEIKVVSDAFREARLAESLGLYSAETPAMSQLVYTYGGASTARDNYVAAYAKKQAAYQAIADLGGTLPAFALGGQHAGGLRLVGENGPELEYTGPSTIMSNSNTRSLLNNDDVVAELRALREEVRNLRAENKAGDIAIERNTSKTAKMVDRWEGIGMPVSRTA